MTERFTRVLQKMTPGTMGGQSRVATMAGPTSSVKISDPPAPPELCGVTLVGDFLAVSTAHNAQVIGMALDADGTEVLLTFDDNTVVRLAYPSLAVLDDPWATFTEWIDIFTVAYDGTAIYFCDTSFNYIRRVEQGETSGSFFWESPDNRTPWSVIYNHATGTLFVFIKSGSDDHGLWSVTLGGVGTLVADPLVDPIGYEFSYEGLIATPDGAVWWHDYDNIYRWHLTDGVTATAWPHGYPYSLMPQADNSITLIGGDAMDGWTVSPDGTITPAPCLTAEVDPTVWGVQSFASSDSGRSAWSADGTISIIVGWEDDDWPANVWRIVGP